MSCTYKRALNTKIFQRLKTRWREGRKGLRWNSETGENQDCGTPKVKEKKKSVNDWVRNRNPYLPLLTEDSCQSINLFSLDTKVRKGCYHQTFQEVFCNPTEYLKRQQIKAFHVYYGSSRLVIECEIIGSE